MTCPHPSELSAHLDGESGPAAALLEQHLAHCESCRRVSQRYAALRPALARVRGPEGEEFLERARRRRTPAAGLRGPERWRLAAVLVTLVLAAWLTGSGPRGGGGRLPTQQDPRAVRAAAADLRDAFRRTFAESPVLEVAVEAGPWFGGGQARVRYGPEGRFVAVTESLFGVLSGRHRELFGLTGERTLYAGYDGVHFWTYRQGDRAVRVRKLGARTVRGPAPERRGLAVFNWTELRAGLTELGGADVTHAFVREEWVDGELLDVVALRSATLSLGSGRVEVWVRRHDLAIVQARVADLATLTFSRPAEGPGGSDFSWTAVTPDSVVVERVD